MAATCIQAEGRKYELEERKFDRRLNRRDTTILIDSMPVEKSFHKPKVIYRRLSRQRYGPPKPKYGRIRPQYGPTKSNRNPMKKSRGKINPKYGPPSHKKRASKPRYGLPKRPGTKPAYVHSKNKPKPHFSSSSYQPEPMGFGEPPSNFDNYRPPKPDYDDFQKNEFEDFHKPEYDNFQNLGFSDFHKPGTSDYYQSTTNPHKSKFSLFQKPNFSSFQLKPTFDGFQKQNFEDYPPKQGYGEPPVDSYGAPIQSSLHDLALPTSQSFPDSSSHIDQDTFNSNLKSWKTYQQDQNMDSKYSFSNNLPMFTKPDSDVFVTPVPEHIEEELGLNSYSDIYNYRQMKNKKKPYQSIKMMNKPWKNIHKKPVDDEIIVGGQYAEPPARYVHKFQPSASMFNSDDEFVPPGHLLDPESVASATNSPYVNYKNSNMAFSPQNLNDAFSIRDK